MKRFVSLLLLPFALAAQDLPEGVTAPEPLDPGEAPRRTIVDSESLTMQSLPDRNLFYFTGNVVVTGTNLRVLCDEMEVIANRVREDAEAAIGEIGSIEKIVAMGNVRIFQAGREARAGRAEVLPETGKVVLTDNPIVIDSQAEVTGWRITLEQGAKTALVEQDPSGNQRPTVRLDALPDLGYDPAEEEDEDSTTEATEEDLPQNVDVEALDLQEE